MAVSRQSRAANAERDASEATPSKLNQLASSPKPRRSSRRNRPGTAVETAVVEAVEAAEAAAVAEAAAGLVDAEVVVEVEV